RVDGDDRIAGVVVAGEETLHLEIREPLAGALLLLLQLAGDRLVLGGHLLERFEVVDVRLELAVSVELALGARVLRGDLRRPLLVVPEAGLSHVLLERLQALAQRSWVKGSPRAASAGHGATRDQYRPRRWTCTR